MNSAEAEYANEREKLVRALVSAGVIRSPQVIRAMRTVPRHIFVPEEQRRYAYIDTPLSIGMRQTISAPHMVGMMAEALELERGSRVLEVGTGSGYHAAVVAEIINPTGGAEGGHLYSLEVIPKLVERATRNLAEAGYSTRVTVVCRDGSEGYAQKAPYDRILVTAAAPDIPPPLVQQLKIGGVLVIPVGGRYFFQRLMRVRKVSDRETESEDLGGVAFVPLVGRFGFRE